MTLSMTRSCPSDLLLDRLLTGELDDARAVEAHLAACPECQERRGELTRSAEAFLAAHPALPPRPAPMPASVRPRRRLGVTAFAVGAAACAAALALTLSSITAPSGLRAKGGFAFDVYVKRKSGTVEKLDAGGVVRPHEAIRFRVTLPRPAYVSVLSIDPAGQRSSYLPSAAAARQLPAGPAQELDGSVELDDTLGEERLLALFCEAPPDLARLVAESDPTAPRDCIAASLIFVKAR